MIPRETRLPTDQCDRLDAVVVTLEILNGFGSLKFTVDCLDAKHSEDAV